MTMLTMGRLLSTPKAKDGPLAFKAQCFFFRPWPARLMLKHSIMHENSSVKLKRDCAAVQIPVGTAVTLPAETMVSISQTLGGSYTVQTDGGLFRIAAQDADALGIEPEPTSLMEEVAKRPAASGPVDEKQVWDTLKTCFDPEIPVNIVDLGLIYDMRVETLPGGNSKVLVKMTLTAPGCGMGTVIASDAQQKILYLPGVEEALVEIVWDPPWHQSMITAEGRRVLGLD
jgi:probable FeS assembly SUF system protein SufT